jgi:prepilin-type processing-associated H-X9-DG protein
MRFANDKPLTAFTLIELLVVIAILTLLTVIMIPAISHCIEAGRRSNCRSNLRQCGLGAQLYADDHNGILPPAVAPANTTDVGMNIEHSNMIEKWGLIYPQYTQDLDVFWCPSRRNGTRFSSVPGSLGNGKKEFGVNIGAIYCESSYGHVSGRKTLPLRQRDIREPSKKVWGLDIFWADSDGKHGASVCHGNGYYNVLYFDAHVSVFVDTTGYLETINAGGGRGALIPGGYTYIEEHDNE